MRGVDPHTGAELKIEREGPTVGITAGFGHDTGTVYLTPTQAIYAAKLIRETAEAINPAVEVTSGG